MLLLMIFFFWFSLLLFFYCSVCMKYLKFVFLHLSPFAPTVFSFISFFLFLMFKSDYYNWSLFVLFVVGIAVVCVLIKNLLKTFVSFVCLLLFVLFAFGSGMTSTVVCIAIPHSVIFVHSHIFAIQLLNQYLPSPSLLQCIHLHVNSSLKMSFNRKYVMFVKWDVSYTLCLFVDWLDG